MVHYLTIVYTTLVIGMVYIERNSHLDLLFQKALRYEHHRENFKESVSNNVTPFGLCIKKAPAIVPVNEDFHIKWQKIVSIHPQGFKTYISARLTSIAIKV